MHCRTSRTQTRPSSIRLTPTIAGLAGETAVITRQGTRRIEALAGGSHELLVTGGDWLKARVECHGRQKVWEVTLSRSGVRAPGFAFATWTTYGVPR